MVLGHVVSPQVLEGLETKIIMWVITLSTDSQLLIKTLDNKAWVSFPGWEYSVHVAAHGHWGNMCYTHDSMPGMCWTLPYVPLPFAVSILYLFTVVNHNSEYNGFSQNYEPY